MPEQSVRDAIETSGPDARFFGNQPRSFGKKFDLAPQPEKTTPEKPRYLGQRLLQLEKLFLAEQSMLKAAMDPGSQVEVIINNPTRPEEFDPTKPFDVSPNQKPYLDKDAETKAIERRLQIEQAIAKINEQKKTNLYGHSALAFPLLELEALQHGHDLSRESINQMDYATTQAILAEPWLKDMIHNGQFNEARRDIAERSEDALIEEALFNMQRQGLVGTLSDFLWNREEDVSTFAAEGNEDSTKTHNILSKMLNRWRGGPKINRLKKQISSAIKKQEEKLWKKYEKDLDNHYKQTTIHGSDGYNDEDFQQKRTWYHKNNPQRLLDSEEIKSKTILQTLERYNDSPYKMLLPKELRTLREQIELVKTESFEKNRAKKTEKTLSILRLLTTVEATQMYGWAGEFMAELSSAPDANPMRPIKAGLSILELHGEIISSPNQALETTLEYLQRPEKVSPVIEYFLTDYFESGQYFTPEEKAVLIQKSTEFVAECASRYSQGAEGQESLIEYLSASANDPDLQKALAFSLLPFAAYLGEHEDLARDISNNLTSPDRTTLTHLTQTVPQLGRIVFALLAYDPDNITLNYDGAEVARNVDQKIPLPHEVINAINQLAENPHYLPPGEFIPTVQEAYNTIWEETYGTQPPPIYREANKPVVESQHVINRVIEGALSGDSKLLENDQIGFEYKAENESDWFLVSTINTPGNFGGVFHTISNDDPYKEKFGFSEKFFMDYYYDYVHHIQDNGSPENPMPESDLFAYALVKCNGNYTEATKEMAMLYKFITRYNLETGASHGAHESPDPTISGGQHFYRTTFREQNIPVLLSIQNQQSQYEQATQDLMRMPLEMSDISERNHNIGDKEGDPVDYVGWHYHAWANRAISQLGYATPYQIAIGHAVNEFPFFINQGEGGSINFTANPSGSNKYAVLTTANLDNLFLNEIVRQSIPTTTEVELRSPTAIYTQSVSTYDAPALITKNMFSPKPPIFTIDPEFGYYAAVNPNNLEETIIYAGHPDSLEQHLKQRYPGVFINISRNPDQFIDQPKLITTFKTLDLPLPVSYLDNYLNQETNSEALKTYLTSSQISLDENPEYIPLFIELKIPIPHEDLSKLVARHTSTPTTDQDMQLNITIESNLTIFSEAGLIDSPDHPIAVGALMSSSLPAQHGYLEYFHTLDEVTQQNILRDQDNSYNFYHNLRSVYSHNSQHYDEHAGRLLTQYSQENIAADINLLINHMPEDKGRDEAINTLPYLFPYFTAENLQDFIENDSISTGQKAYSILEAYKIIANSDTTTPPRLPQISDNTQELVRVLKLNSDPVLSLCGSGIELINGDLDSETFESLVIREISLDPKLAFSQYFYSIIRSLYYYENSPITASVEFIDSFGDAYAETKDEDGYKDMEIYSNLVTDFGNEEQFLRYIQQSQHPLFDQDYVNETIVNWLENNIERGQDLSPQQVKIFEFLYSENDSASVKRHTSFARQSELATFYLKWGEYIPQDNVNRMTEQGSFATAPELIRYQIHQEMVKNEHTVEPFVLDQVEAMSEILSDPELSLKDQSTVDLIHNHLSIQDLIQIIEHVDITDLLLDSHTNVFDFDQISQMSGYNSQTSNDLSRLVHDVLEKYKMYHSLEYESTTTYLSFLTSSHTLLSSNQLNFNYSEEVLSTLDSYESSVSNPYFDYFESEIIDLSYFAEEDLHKFQSDFPILFEKINTQSVSK